MAPATQQAREFAGVDLDRADADFHEAIAEASHNRMFLYLHTSILRMLREHISLNLIGIESHTMVAHIDFTWSELKRREKRRAARDEPAQAAA